jgi:diguanylate cyclase (GGDEF)-like protein
MSFIRQIWLLLLLALALAFSGAVSIAVFSERHYLEQQLSLKNQDSARTLALAMSQRTEDLSTASRSLAAQFELGLFQYVLLKDAQGLVLSKQVAAAEEPEAPRWVARYLSVQPLPGLAPVLRGTSVIGSIEVQSQSRFSVQELWQTVRRLLWGVLTLTLVIAAMAYLVLQRIRQPLRSMVRQAQSLTERRFITVAEPDVPELRNVTRAMNGMVERLRTMFEEQAGQVELLRRQAHCDELTGVSNRVHFLGRLKSLLNDEDGGAGGVLVMVRICDLQGINRRLGRVQTDRLLREAGATLRSAGTHAGSGFEAGRLNGSDFAVMLPEASSLREPATELAARLRELLPRYAPDANAVIGAVRWWHGAPVSALLAAADHALARAEARGNFAVELYDAGDAATQGEDAWRGQLNKALELGGASLMEFAVLDVNRDVHHLECPLRLCVNGIAEPVAAAQWLPMARRAMMTARIDLQAVELALKAMGSDGMARSVNLCSSSLRDPTLMPQLRMLLSSHEAQAPGLWLEVAESGALRELRLLRELVQMAHARGAKVGLEHAGAALADGGALLELGLDFVKLDASFTEGLSTDAARAQHVAGTVRMLHGLGIKTFAEGVNSAEDARLLWQVGVEGVTGPVTDELSMALA